MKSIVMKIFRKRWFIFVALIVTTFFMNLFLWNETTQLIRIFPSLEILRQESENNSYEFQYQMDVSENDLVEVRLTIEAQEELYHLFSQDFLESNASASLFSNRFEFVNGGSLEPITDDILKETFLQEKLNIPLLEDFLIRALSEEKRLELQSVMKRLSLPVEIVSFKQTYLSVKDYYIENFWFGLIVCSVLLLISLFLLRQVLKSALKICQDEIRVLRIIGCSKKRITHLLSYMMISPVIVGIFIFFVFIYSMAVGVLVWDYVYLTLLNAVVLTWIVGLVCYELSRRVL